MLNKIFQSFRKGKTTNQENTFLSLEEIQKLQNDFPFNLSITKKTKAILPSPDLIKKYLGTDKEFSDQNNYLHEILAMAIKGDIVCVIESKEKQIKDLLDISIKCKIITNTDVIKEKDIESYNPFFGCEVHFIEWFEDSVIFVYSEKHNTYIGKYKTGSDIVFQNIGRNWKNSKNLFAFYKWNDEHIYVVDIPELDIIGKISKNNAKEIGINPD